MIYWFIKKIIRLARESFFLSFILFLSIFLTYFIYSIFYSWYLPKAKFERNVAFQLLETYNRNYNGPALVGSTDLFSNNIERFHFGQEYTISLVLDMPESDLNFDIGLFGVTLDALDSEGRKSLTQKTMVKEMGTMVYKSKLLRYLLTIFYFPSYLIGRYEQKQKLTLILKDDFVDNPYLPAQRFIVSIHEKIQFYSVKFVAEANFTGLKYFLYHWYYTTSFLLCFTIMGLIFGVFLTSFYDVKSYFFKSTKEPNIDSQIVPVKNEIQIKDKNFDDYVEHFEFPDDSTDLNFPKLTFFSSIKKSL